MRAVRLVLCSIAILASGYVYFLTTSQPTAAQSQPAAAAPRFALLVGINKYKVQSDPGLTVSTLEGTHNDVAMMKTLLVEKYSFTEDVKAGPSAAAPCGSQTPASNVVTLCSQQATKAAILSGLDNLITRAETHWGTKSADPLNGPHVVFYFSGHGSRVGDDNNEEADMIDETIVPYDSDKNGIRDIRDDELATRIAQLKRYTSNIVIMTDSCHSGTNVRGGGMKGIERDIPTSGTRGAGGSSDNMVSDAGYTAISGSRPTQFSFERDMPLENGAVQKNGLLTYFFVRHLNDHPGATYKEIITMVQNSIAGRGEMQEPQVEGAIERAVFGTAASAGKRAIAIKCKTSGDMPCSEKIQKTDDTGKAVPARKITLDVGTIGGARQGGRVVVYAPGAKELAGPADRLAEGVISAAAPFSSDAEIYLAAEDSKDLSSRVKVVLVSPSFGAESPVVAVDVSGSDAGSKSMASLAAILKKSSYVTPVETTDLLKRLNDNNGQDPGSNWSLAVIRGTYADFKIGRAKTLGSKEVPPDSQIGYFLGSRNGHAIYDLWVPADATEAVLRMQTALEHHVKAQNVRAMRNATSQLNGKIKVEVVMHKAFQEGSDGRCVVTPYAPGERKPSTPGDERISISEAFHLKITNTSTKPLYLYIYSIDSNATIGLLYPPEGAGETFERNATFVTNASGPCTTFYFDETSPLGGEMIKIIASEKPIDASILTSPGIKRSSGGIDSPLEQMLRQAGSNTRTVTGGSKSVGDWTTVEVPYTVVPAKRP